MNFAGTVWRIVPAKAFALHAGYILRARGRWNREGMYGCLYTALTPEGALAEWAKYLRAAGVAPALSSARDLVSLAVRVESVLDLTSDAMLRQIGIEREMLTGDAEDSLELCRVIADLAQQRGYHAILSPSAALAGAVNLKPLSQRPRRPLLAGRRSRKGEGHCGDAPAVLLSAPEPTLSSPSSHR